MKSLAPVAIPTATVTAVCAIVAAVVAGTDGALGAVLGGLVVVLFLGSTPLALGPMIKASATLSLPIALGFLATKSIAMLVVLLLLFDVAGIATHVDTTWFGIAAIVASLVWTVLQVRTFQRARVLTYDLSDDV